MGKQYGKVGWDDNNKTNKFLSLNNGGNKVRLVSDVYKYLTHKVKFDGDKNKYGRTIKCALNDCPLCKEGELIKPKYIAAVLHDDDVKILDMGTLLYNKIKGIKNHMEGYDDPRDYNINVVREPDGGPQNFYQAYPAEKKPLTAEQMAIVESKFDETELENYCEPPSPEEVLMSIKKIKSYLDNSNSTSDEEQTQKVSTGDDDYEFVVKKK